MNKVTLHGRMAKDPEYRTTTTGKNVATFTLAVGRPKKQDGTQETDFLPCVVWGKLADTVNQYCNKGKELLIEGRIQVRSYDANDGSKRYVTEVIVNELEFCGSKGGNNAPAGGGFGGTPADGIDIPF